MSHELRPAIRSSGTSCERLYALYELAPREALVFKSMVRLLDGQTRDRWSLSGPDHADLLVITCNDETVRPGVPRLQIGGTGDYVVGTPLRADELRVQLDRVSSMLQVPPKVSGPRVPVAAELRRLQLLRWPEPELLRHQPHHAQLLTVLGVKPCSMDDLSARAGVPLAICHAFAARLHASGAACWLIDSPPAAPAGLMARLRATLGAHRSA